MGFPWVFKELVCQQAAMHIKHVYGTTQHIYNSWS
jgi:hypothetical protein